MAADWHMISVDKEGPIAVVSLSNPSLNVLHPQMVEELAACFAGLADDPEVLVAIVTGAGERAFCAGFDIKEFPGLLVPGRAERLAQRLHASLGAIEKGIIYLSDGLCST
jgi:enoyl-CoA hydratase/carnithine racemase